MGGFVLLMVFVNLLVGAGAMQAMWGWFLVPIGAPDVMTYPLALGVLLTLLVPGALSVHGGGGGGEKEDVETFVLRFLIAAFGGVLTTMLIWGVAYLVHLFV
jgi:hypothetical protein